MIRNNIRWNVSGAFAHDDILLALFDIAREVFDNTIFNSVHGSVPCKFNSGRRSINCSDDYIKECIREYHKRGIPLNLTFSNFMLQKEDLLDRESNRLLSMLNVGDGVIIASDYLYEYIKKKYPHLKIISSVLTAVNSSGERDALFYNMLSQKYDVVVIHPDDNFNTDIIYEMKEKNKFEVLVNERCIYRCPHRFEHDKLICLESLNPNQNTAYECKVFAKTNCLAEKEKVLLKLMKAGNIKTVKLSEEEVENLMNLGYRNFKLQGRTDSPATFAYDLCKYLVNDEYKDIVFNAIVRNFSFLSIKDKFRKIEL